MSQDFDWLQLQMYFLPGDGELDQHFQQGSLRDTSQGIRAPPSKACRVIRIALQCQELDGLAPGDFTR